MSDPSTDFTVADQDKVQKGLKMAEMIKDQGAFSPQEQEELLQEVYKQL
jgi:hypothetical protein